MLENSTVFNFAKEKFYNSLSSYFCNYILDIFTKQSITITEDLKDLLKNDVNKLIRRNISFSYTKYIKYNYDKISLNAFDINYFLGYEKTSKIVKRSLNILYNIISNNGPYETLESFLKTNSNFRILIQCCFKNHIENYISGKFDFLSSVGHEKKEILIEKIIDNVTNNYSYYKKFDPSISKFKTFLNNDIFYKSISIFREENLFKKYYVFSDEYLNKLEISTTHNQRFYNKKQLVSYLNNNLVKSYDTIKRKEYYTNNFTNLEDSLATNLHSKEIFVHEFDDVISTCKNYIKIIENFEKSILYRFIYKLYTGTHINYLGVEIHLIFGAKLTPVLVQQLIKIQNYIFTNSKSLFFKSIKSFLIDNTDLNIDVDYKSIQQRTYRLLKKISELYKKNELNEIISTFYNGLQIDLIDKPIKLLYCSSKYEMENLINIAHKDTLIVFENLE